MSVFKIAAQTVSFAQPIKQALHTAAAVGCEGVEIDARSEIRPAELSETGLRQLRKLLADLNLRVAAISFPTRRGFANPADLERRVDGARAAMRLASQLHAGVLVCNIGQVSGPEGTATRETLVEVLTALATHGNHLGVQLAAQASIADLQYLTDLVAELPEGALSLDLHPARLIAQGHSPTAFVDTLGRHIAHVHAVDAYYDVGGGQLVEVELGRGSCDFPDLLGRLEQYEYRGWVTVERRHSRQVRDDFANAVQYLRSLQM